MEGDVTELWDRVWDFIVRFRTWLLSIVSIILAIDPSIILSVIPDLRSAIGPEYDKWITITMVGSIGINRSMR